VPHVSLSSPLLLFQFIVFFIVHCFLFVGEMDAAAASQLEAGLMQKDDDNVGIPEPLVVKKRVHSGKMRQFWLLTHRAAMHTFRLVGFAPSCYVLINYICVC
jgi:hypothetical protein